MGRAQSPSNVVFKNNKMQASGNGIKAQNVEGTNYWTGIELTDTSSNSSTTWQVSQQTSGTTNFVNSNTVAGYKGQSYCDSSCIF